MLLQTRHLAGHFTYKYLILMTYLCLQRCESQSTDSDVEEIALLSVTHPNYNFKLLFFRPSWILSCPNHTYHQFQVRHNTEAWSWGEHLVLSHQSTQMTPRPPHLHDLLLLVAHCYSQPIRRTGVYFALPLTNSQPFPLLSSYHLLEATYCPLCPLDKSPFPQSTYKVQDTLQ